MQAEEADPLPSVPSLTENRSSKWEKQTFEAADVSRVSFADASTPRQLEPFPVTNDEACPTERHLFWDPNLPVRKILQNHEKPHAFSSVTFWENIVEFVPTIQIALSIVCLGPQARRACESELRRRVCARRRIHVGEKCELLEMSDGLKLTFVPRLRSTFFHLSDVVSCGLIFGILIGPAARNIVTLSSRVPDHNNQVTALVGWWMNVPDDWLPRIHRVVAHFLKCDVQVELSKFQTTRRDCSHLVSLQTPPSDSLRHRINLPQVVCRVDLWIGCSLFDMFSLRGKIGSSNAKQYNSFEFEVHAESEITNFGIVAAKTVSLQKPSSRIVTSLQIPRIVRSAPLIDVGVFIDGLSNPIGRLSQIAVNTPLAQLRRLLKTALPWASSLIENCDVAVFRNRTKNAGRHRKNSTRDEHSRVDDDVRVHEQVQTLFDALPPTKGGQFLQKTLTGAEMTICGWRTRDISFWKDTFVGAVVLRPPVHGMGGLQSDGLQLQGPASRVRQLRAQRAKDALREIHPALQLYFVAQGAAHDACRRGDLPMLQQLIEPSQNHVVSPISGSLHPSSVKTANAALYSGRLPQDLPVISPNDKLAASLMHTAASHGRRHVLDFLVGSGFAVNRCDDDGQFPLHRAASKGHAECIPTLLRARDGMKCLNEIDQRGRTPLHCALSSKFMNTALWLVEQGANPDIRDPCGFSAADSACTQLPQLSDFCRSGDVDSIRNMLLGALPLQESSEPTSEACATVWYTEMLKHRLTRGRTLLGLRAHSCVHPTSGAVIDNVCGISAFHEAIICGHTHVVELLLSSPFVSLVDVNETTRDGSTPLHLAASSRAAGEVFPLILDYLERLGSHDNSHTDEPMRSLFRVNHRGETPLHVCLSRRPAVAAQVLVHTLTRCQANPAQYPLADFGHLVLHKNDACKLSVCHLAVARSRHLPEGVVAALIAAALNATTTTPTYVSNLRVSLISEAFELRFPGRAEHRRKPVASRPFSSPSLWHMCILNGSPMPTLNLLTDLLAHCVQQDIIWPLSEFGSLASPGLLKAAYVRNDVQTFKHIVQVCCSRTDERLRPHFQLDVAATQSRSRVEDGDVIWECVEVPLAWIILSESRSEEWIETALEFDILVNSIRQSDQAAFEFNSINNAEPAISCISQLVDHVAHIRETQRQFPRSRENGSGNVHLDFLLTSEKLMLIALRRLLTVMNPIAIKEATATERSMFSRRVLFAAIRCCGIDAPFQVLLSSVEGTHVFDHRDLVRATNLGAHFGLAPSTGVSFGNMRADGRMYTPAEPTPMRVSRQPNTENGSRGISRGSLWSRGSQRRLRSQGASSGNGDDDETGEVVVIFEEHPFEKHIRLRELQLCQLIPFIAALQPGALLHELCSRRLFAAAMTLLVTATANAHHVTSSQLAAIASPARSKSRSPVFRNPIVLRHDNVDLRCRELESSTGVTALHIAAQFGVSQLVHALLRTGQFRSREVSAARKWTPMHWAARYGHTETCRILLSVGVLPTDVSDPTGSGSVLGTTPLHLAAVSGSVELVRVLVDHHAPIDARSVMGRTPLHLASRQGHTDVAVALIDFGAKLDREDDEGNTPLLLAAQEGHGQLIVKLVAHCKADHLLLSVNRKTGTSLAHYASWLSGTAMNAVLFRCMQLSSSLVRAQSSQATRDGSAASRLTTDSVAAEVPRRTLRPLTAERLVARDGLNSNRFNPNGSFVAKPISCNDTPLESIRQFAEKSRWLDICTVESNQKLCRSSTSTRPSTAASEAIQTSRQGLSIFGVASASATTVGAAMLRRACEKKNFLGDSLCPRKGDNDVRGVAPRGGSLDIFQHLVDATESRRVEKQDMELYRFTHKAANLASQCCGSDSCQLRLPTSFTTIHRGVTVDDTHIGFHEDRRGVHPWVPLQYALANGKKEAAKIIKDQLGAQAAKVNEIILDVDEMLASKSETAIIRERRKTEAFIRAQFPKVEIGTIPLLITMSTNQVTDTVFVPLPPAPPLPKLWHPRYYSCCAGDEPGLCGLMSKLTKPTSSAGLERLGECRTFSELSRRRIMTSAAWLVKHSLHEDLFRYLPILSSVDEPVDDESRITLLMIAAYFNRAQVAQVLIEYGADVNATARLRKTKAETLRSQPNNESGGLTPIIVAAAAGCREMVDTLIANDANVDVVDECGNTPVHHAVFRKDFNMLKALLHAGAQIHVANHAGDTPEDIAVALRIHNIIRMLRWWSMAFSVEPNDLRPHREPCRTEIEYASWIDDTRQFYRRLDMLHDHGLQLTNKAEKDSVPALMYIRLCQRLKVQPSKYVVSCLVPYWWPEEVHVLQLEGIFMDEASLGALFTFLKLLTHLEDFQLSDGKLTDETIIPLCTSCREHPHIRRLYLSGNRGLGRTAAFHLLDLITQNTNIVAIDVSATSIDAPHSSMLRRQLETNMKRQSLLTQDPTKSQLSTKRRRVPYHLPRVSKVDAKGNIRDSESEEEES